MSETIEQTEKTEQQAPTKRKYTRRKRAVRATEPFKAPDEFAGLTATECCDACYENTAAAEAAQKRLNEIDKAYERKVSRLPNSPTVMESDSEWLARQENAPVADEFRKLSKVAQGQCAISQAPGCAHPFKSGLSPQLKRDPKTMARYGRAKKALAHQMIDLRDR